MQTITQSALSTQYMQVLIAAISPSGAYNPTADTVSFGFTPDGPPFTGPSSWQPGSWSTWPGPQFWAQILIGPGTGGYALAAGSWLGWVKVTDNPEVPVLQPFRIQIT